jgi:hypothetical protein
MNITTEWLAGLFEGEGSIYFDKSNKQWRMKLKMTDEDVVTRFHEGAGVGKVYYEPHKTFKPTWNWVLFRKAEVKAFLIRLLPLLGNRRACKTLDALDYFDDCYNCTAPN